jgi:hypothetical protein
MLPARAEIARERRRQMQVRKAFDAGLALDGGYDPVLVPFFEACADYLIASMDRLHAQDQLIHDLLSARIPSAETDAHERLATLNERQRQSRALVAEFAAAAADLRRMGAAALGSFVPAARQFAEAFRGLMAPRRNPFFKHTDALFSDEDWVRIAGVTEESLQTEERLFSAIQRAAPDGCDPSQFTAEHLAPG